MKNCTNCTYADWKRTSAGKLHPSGDGMCKFPWEMPPLPASMFFGFSPGGVIPRPNGGRINRKRDLPDHCKYFLRDNG